MARARCDVCPMCDTLAWWRVGDRVAVLQNEQGVVIGVDCDSCGGWRDAAAVRDLVDELDALGFGHAAGDPAQRDSVQASDPPASRTR